jgi:hypothetical protein
MMKVGEFDIELSAETSLETLIALGYYCAYDGSEADAALVRPKLQAKDEQCSDETLKNHAAFALSMMAKEAVDGVDFAEYLSKFDSYTVSEQISMLAYIAYAERFDNNSHYDDIKKIYDGIIFRCFDHEPEAVYSDYDEDDYNVDYGNLIVDLSDMDLLNLVAVDHYLFMNVPLGLGPDTTLSIVAELERRSERGDQTATAALAWSVLYFNEEH